MTATTEAEKLHQRAAALREDARRVRASGDRERSAILMREAGTVLRRARRMALSLRHGGVR